MHRKTLPAHPARSRSARAESEAIPAYSCAAATARERQAPAVNNRGINRLFDPNNRHQKTGRLRYILV